MGNLPVRTSYTNPLIICSDPHQNQKDIEYQIVIDSSDNSSDNAAEFDATQQNISQSNITAVYARRKYRRKAIIVAKTSRRLDETEIQDEY